MWIWASKWGSGRGHPSRSPRPGHPVPGQVRYGQDCSLCHLHPQSDRCRKQRLLAPPGHYHLSHSWTGSPDLQGLQKIRYWWNKFRSLFQKSWAKIRLLFWRCSSGRQWDWTQRPHQNSSYHHLHSWKALWPCQTQTHSIWQGNHFCMQCKFFVIDECDKVLGNPKMRADIQDIFVKTPHHKQVLMFSATMPEEMKKGKNVSIKTAKSSSKRSLKFSLMRVNWFSTDWPNSTSISTR